MKRRRFQTGLGRSRRHRSWFRRHSPTVPWAEVHVFKGRADGSKARAPVSEAHAHGSRAQAPISKAHAHGSTAQRDGSKVRGHVSMDAGCETLLARTSRSLLL